MCSVGRDSLGLFLLDGKECYIAVFLYYIHLSRGKVNGDYFCVIVPSIEMFLGSIHLVEPDTVRME